MDDFISNVIVKMAGKNKFLEFKDGMNPAYTKHYAMLTGTIGKEYAENSGIQVAITDYSEEGNTKQASVLVPCYVFEQIKEICLKNTGKTIVCSPQITEGRRGNESKNGDLSQLLAEQRYIWNSFRVLYKGLRTAAANVVTGKTEKPAAEIGKALKDAFNRSIGKDDSGNKVNPDQVYMEIPANTDWEYSQTRVNSSHPNPDGTCSCSLLSFKRTGYTVKGDAPAVANLLPWFVSVSKFTAFPKENANGTVVYDSHRPITDKIDLNFRTTDEEMMRGAYAVEHFVSQWERAHLEGFIAGLEARKQSYAAKRTAKEKK